MRLYLDDCRMEYVRRFFDLYPVDGVTCNPSILKKCGRPPVEVLTEIRNFIGKEKELMVQVVSASSEDMIREAYRIIEIIGDGKYYVKLPAVPQGIKAIKALSKEGVHTVATGIHGVPQGLLAANAGAEIIAPYICRIDNLGGDGLQVTRELQDILNIYHYDVKIIPGSIRTTRQIVECAKIGIAGITISPDMWDTFIKNANVDSAVETFTKDFETLVGEGKTFLDL